MKHLRKINYLISIIILCAGVLLLYRALGPKSNDGAQQPIINQPDYSGIQIKRVISRMIKDGVTKKVGVGDRITTHIAIWIYDPKRPGNRGLLVYQSSEPQKYFIESQKTNTLTDHLLGMSVGSIKELIVPPKKLDLLKPIVSSLSADKIYLVELRMYHVF